MWDEQASRSQLHRVVLRTPHPPIYSLISGYLAKECSSFNHLYHHMPKGGRPVGVERMDFREHLGRQLGFIRRSCESFDKGHTD